MSAATVCRAQHAKSYRLSGAHGGRKISSGGIAGTCSHDQRPKSDSQIFVNTRDRSIPPWSRTYSRAFRMWSASVGSPASRSAAYASIVAEWSGGPP